MIYIRTPEFSALTSTEQGDVIALAEAQIMKLKQHDSFCCAFTIRGTRKARITRIGRQGQRFFQSFSASTKTWTKERKLVPQDLIQTSCPR